MMRALAIAVLALASCRKEAAVESRPQPLEPSGNPVAQAHDEPARGDERDDERGDERDDERDDRTATSADPARAPARDDRPARRDTPDDTPPHDRDYDPPSAPAAHEPSIEEQLPPSLYEANSGPKDKADKPVKSDKPDKPDRPRAAKSSRLAPVRGALCVTTGAAKIGGKIDKPSMRAVAKGTDGEGASLTFTFEGELENLKKLDSGAVRRQIGLKLRAENGCNLIYVMWRLDPKPMILAQVKRNPGQKDHKGCGSGGYKWVKAKEQHTPPALTVGTKYTLRAEIENEELSVFVDDTLYWRGALPESVRDLRGPAGIRSDNLAYDLVAFEAASGADAGNAKCVAEDKD